MTDTPTGTKPAPGFVRSLLQLVRLPNCFTAIPDTLAGFLAAVAWTTGTLDLAALAPVMAAVGAVGFLAYAGGVAMNDLFDLGHDREHRPERPLPSGRIPLGVGVLISFGLLLGCLALAIAIQPAAWPAALLLAVCITAYNLLHKKVPKLGLPLMGASRGANVLLGLCIGGLALDGTLLQGSRWPLLIHPVALSGYVLSISIVARLEKKYELAIKAVPRMILGIAILDAIFVLILTGNWIAALIVAVWILPAAFLSRLFAMS